MLKFLMAVLSLLGLASIYLITWPVPVQPTAWQAPEDQGLTGAFAANDKLSSVEIITLGNEEGPEDLAISDSGEVYFSLLDGKIMRLNESNQPELFAETGGRPLGIEFSPDGNLIVADAYKGLLSISADGKEVTLLTKQVKGSPIRYADDVDITDTGVIYFTDASTKFPADIYETYGASLLDIMEHGGHGRVLKYSPETKETTVVLSGLQFANGLAVSHEQDAILINETGSYQVLKHWIEGKKKGTTEVLISNLPGFPDNINQGRDGNYWLGLVSPRSKALDMLSGFPFLRSVVQRLPASLRPKAESFGHVVLINGSGEVITSLQDPRSQYGFTTGAVESGEWLYVSSLHEKVLARLSLSGM
ncbi:SMP-30/gluconolactonase/LRE family protein [Litoribacillus peritrichatus]|uniref:SMP-30/gluconolactonase/LRE family protein n=1 Tax=Litoribacillus peritrichatus TaxID=718191 RepID=A0ABP7MBZ0_9GAMM